MNDDNIFNNYGYISVYSEDRICKNQIKILYAVNLHWLQRLQWFQSFVIISTYLCVFELKYGYFHEDFDLRYF